MLHISSPKLSSETAFCINMLFRLFFQRLELTSYIVKEATFFCFSFCVVYGNIVIEDYFVHITELKFCSCSFNKDVGFKWREIMRFPISCNP